MFTHRTLEAWKEARHVSVLVLKVSEEYWKPWAGAHFDQMQRASASVHLNITEGYSFGAKPSYVRHLGIAYGSAVEVGDVVELLLETQVLPKDVEELLHHNQRCQRLLVGLLKKRRPFPSNAAE